jgi:hypothetical protein
VAVEEEEALGWVVRALRHLGDASAPLRPDGRRTARRGTRRADTTTGGSRGAVAGIPTAPVGFARRSFGRERLRSCGGAGT